jgi:hypothetical protein
MFYAEPEAQGRLCKAMEEYRELVFKFDIEGAKVIYAGDECCGHARTRP